MSALVEESLSVSGILLGKTMGRSDELAERFSAESEHLADLEVRSRMAGRWRMSTVQMSFAIMPALVYLFAGLSIAGGVGLDHDRHGRRLHDAADAAAVPDRLAAERRHRHPDVARAVRPDLRVPRPARRDRRARGPRRARGGSERRSVRGEVRFDDVAFRYEEDGAPTLDGVDLVVAPGTKTAIVGETGSGKTTLGYLVARLYDVTGGRVTIDGVDVRDLSFASLARTVGLVSQETYLFHATIADNLRFANPDATDERARRRCARRAHPRPHRLAARRLRHGRRRARLPLLRRREAAHRDRADDPAQPARPRPRRGHERAGLRDRARRPGGARPARRGPHDDRHRPPALDRPRRRRDRRPRPRPDRRARDARRAAWRPAAATRSS